MNLKKFNAIAEGWKNFAFPSKNIEELAKVRAEICSGCPHMTTDYPFKNILPEEKRIEIVKGVACGLCGGCPLQSKLRVPLESCPEKKW